MIRFACPRCQSMMEQPESSGGAMVACPQCGQQLHVPLPRPNKTILGDLVGHDLVPVPPPPPPPVPRRDSYAPGHSDYDREERDPPRGRSRSRSRRDRYDDDDYDYPPPPRSPIRYERGYSTWAATAGFICSLISIGILLLSFVLWIVLADDRRGRWQQSADAIVFVFLFATLGSFVLGILGVVFSSRGLDGSNDRNRGLAITGLVCGIIGLVLSIIIAIPFLLCGMVLVMFRGWR